jgi:hypothetical protein
MAQAALLNQLPKFSLYGSFKPKSGVSVFSKSPGKLGGLGILFIIKVLQFPVVIRELGNQ